MRRKLLLSPRRPRRLTTAAPRPQGRIVVVEGVRMHLFLEGPQDGQGQDARTVVLIHGASGNIRDFTFDFTSRLRNRYRVLAIDRPGFGHSERGGAGAHAPRRQAQLLRGAAAAALGPLERRPPIVLGHSLGCAAALAWALDAPTTVGGLVAVAGVAQPWRGTAGRIYDVGAAPGLGALLARLTAAMASPERIARMIAEIFAPQAPPDGYLEAVGVELALRPATLEANFQDIGRLKPLIRTQAARYPGLAVPLEIVHGESDRIVPARVHAAALAAAAPRARLTLLPGVGHMPHHVAPDAVVAAIDRLAAR